MGDSAKYRIPFSMRWLLRLIDTFAAIILNGIRQEIAVLEGS